MAITATNHFWDLAPMADGTRNSKYPDGTTGSPPSTIIASVRASGWGQTVTDGGTITGPAPLSVFFDLTPTTGEDGIDAFREYGYYHKFGYATPTTPGSFTHSGEPKGIYIGGPLAPHVYQTPGTYTYTGKVENAAATTDTVTCTIVVQDPDVVYATTDTICVHNGGAATGGPAGCSYHDASTAWPTWAANKRYLLKRGDTFTTAGTITVNVSGCHFNYYGSGANPLINGNFLIATTQRSSSAFIVDKCQVSHIDAVLVTGGRFYRTNRQARGIGFHDCNGNIEFNSGYLYFNDWAGRVAAGVSDSWFVVNDTFIVSECNSDRSANNNPGTGGYCAFPHYTQYAGIVGCTFDAGGISNGTHHVIRLESCYKYAIQHNHTKRPYVSGTLGLHHVTPRAKGRMEWATAFASMCDTAILSESRYGVIGRNKVGTVGEENVFKYSIYPTDTSYNEAISDVIVEACIFYSSTGGTRRDIRLGGIRHTVRNCTLVDGETRNTDAQMILGIGQNADWTGPYYFQEYTPTLADEFESDPMIEPSAP